MLPTALQMECELGKITSSVFGVQSFGVPSFYYHSLLACEERARVSALLIQLVG
jgi:hypothetical protein